jgi:hypothetical protein
MYCRLTAVTVSYGQEETFKLFTPVLDVHSTKLQLSCFYEGIIPLSIKFDIVLRHFKSRNTSYESREKRIYVNICSNKRRKGLEVLQYVSRGFCNI